MVYRKVQGDFISYQVYDKEELAAEFTYRIESSRSAYFPRFWIDRLRLCVGYDDWRTMEAVLRFLEYKCRAACCPAMQVRIDRKNLSVREMYLHYGFYMIDEEEMTLAYGQSACVSVLKYPVPGSREEVFRGYIMQCERARAGKLPG